MKAPDKIYIAETPNKLIEIWSDEPIEPKPYITEHEYIRKDALLEWANDIKQGLIVEIEKYGIPNEQRAFAFQEFIDKLNSL